MSSRSISSSRCSESDSRPLRTQTWQVEQAQTPPQEWPTWAPAFSAASSSVVPGDTSTVTSSRGLLKWTLGTSELLDRMARDDLRHGLVHDALDEGLAGLVQGVDGLLEGLGVLALGQLAYP